MANLILHNELTVEDKILRMKDDAQYEIAMDREIDSFCTVDLSMLSGIRAKPGPPTVPKVFVSNDCIFNCAYCGCRSSHDKQRYCSTPAELAKIALLEAKKNTHGVFITSAIYKNADYTQEMILKTLKIIRETYLYSGYLHAKVMPGADPLLIEQTGRYANRMSVNIEVAKSEGYDKIAKQKNRTNILTPMGQISDCIKNARQYRGKYAVSQTTQLMAGSTGEDDRTIMNLSRALYRKYDLKRVYYTAFQYKHEAKGYSMPLVSTPKWRVRRLYQADRLLELYGFTPDEITPADDPFLSPELDPKASYALRNLHLFPVEVNKADYEMLLRVPGIGTTYAQKIMEARKYCVITHSVLKQMGVSLKRCVYFITCNGTYNGGTAFDNYDVLRQMTADKQSDGRGLDQLSFEL
ncbi:MAG: hypothetical protein BGN88_14525 [Clostridiales bacterium 43-6]|nr:MAG: hypothetical protein BGN88_14525 [Clostridiales bacterium 43-6]